MTQINLENVQLENKIPDTSGFVKKTDYNATFSEIENKVTNISGLLQLLH